MALGRASVFGIFGTVLVDGEGTITMSGHSGGSRPVDYRGRLGGFTPLATFIGVREGIGCAIL